MNKRMKMLTAAGLLAGGFMAGATLQASPPGGSMAGHGAGGMMSGGSMMGQGSSGMMDMMQEMTRMIGNCNRMMESDGGEKHTPDGTRKPAG
jgi:hypothetical protein